MDRLQPIDANWKPTMTPHTHDPTQITGDWFDRIDAPQAAALLAWAQRQGLLEGHDTVIIHDLSRMLDRLSRVRAAFAPSALHALAIKANALVQVLRAAADAGFGLEAASIEEVALARAAGCPAQRIVFDSPAKRTAEIRQALEWGVLINADNFDELDRIATALKTHAIPPPPIGLRVNPQTGAGSISTTSVAAAYSKFGVSLSSDRLAIIDAFERHPWLTGLHAHIGSQGVTVAQMVESVRRIFELRSQIAERVGEGRIGFVDIGGGLPWRYRLDQQPASLDDFVAQLRQAVPQAWEPGVRLVTEFGRSIQAGCGIAASRVEYVKKQGDHRIAVIHLGADLLMRRVYHPADWHHRISVLDAAGAPRQGPLVKQDIAGPLCFGGDFVARGEMLPEIHPGDWVVVHDVGAYTLSMWSRHCNRGIPRVLGHQGDGRPMMVLREAERPEDIVEFWSAP